MARDRSRTFSILDLMILVAAAASCLWLWQHLPLYIWPGVGNVGPETAVFLIWGWSLHVFPFLIPLAPTLVVLQLRRPRLSLRRLTLRPGFAACLAATIGLATGIIMQSIREVVAAMTTAGAIVKLPSPPFVTWPTPTPPPIPGIPEPASVGVTTDLLSRILLVPIDYGHAPAVATAIAVTWAILAIGGRWRPEPTWLDRAGRLVGLVWIVDTLTLLASVILGEFMM